MSLVNDMLRDLDQRRQESPQQKFGAERLVPVNSDVAAVKVNRSLISFVFSIAITLGLIMGALYFWQSMTSVAIQPSPVQPAFTPTPVATIGPSVEQRELEEIALRMQELEAQNRALLEAQTATAAQADATQTQLEDEIAQPASPEPFAQSVAAAEIAAIAAAPSAEPAVQPLQAVSPPPSVSADVAVVPAAEAAVSNSPIRSPRDLSFAERDQMQVQEALRLASRNQNDMAMQQLREFVASNPYAHNSREAMIKLALQKGDAPAAEQLLQAGLALDANRSGYRKLQARMMLGSGQALQAMQLLSTRIPTIQEDVEYHDILATAYLSVQDYEKAAQSYEALVQQNRGESRWWYGLASAWDSLGRTRDAGLAYQEALKLSNLSAALRQRSQQRLAELGL